MRISPLTLAGDPDFNPIAAPQVLQDIGNGRVGQVRDHHVVALRPFHHVIEDEVCRNRPAGRRW